MAGHSQFKNIMYRKGAQDIKRSRLFSKLSREITVAAKIGVPDPDGNPRLRLAIQNARAQNMPGDNIDRAVARAEANDSEVFDSVRYEGYGPGGVAVIVEGLTENRNRTASAVRSAFSKLGGSFLASGAVSFQFSHVGEIVLELPANIGEDQVLEAAVNAGADDVESDGEHHVVICEFDALHRVANLLVSSLGEPKSCKGIWKPERYVAITGQSARNLLRLLGILEENDDIQNVFSNFDIPDDELTTLY